jgi:hypothetical protein
MACIHDTVLRAMYTKKKKAKYAYVGPFRQQTKEIAWDYLKEATKHIRKGQPRESELKIVLPNDATIQLYGADNADAMRGLYFDGIIADEYGDWRPGIWGEIVLPCLMDRKGWAVIIGTMKGKNHFYRMLEKAKQEDGWFYYQLKASESGILPEEDLLEYRKQSTEAQYRQEMECDPDAAVMGTYYSEIIAHMEADGRIDEFVYDETEMVHVSTDLGYTDSTAMWFWQLTPEGPVMIDYEEHDGKTLDFYFKLLKNKPYEYADIWLPHDAKAKSLQTGRSTIEQFLGAGFPCKVVPKLAVQHGIDAARMILPKVRFNKDTCTDGIEALRAYRRQFNEKTQQYSNAPLHDWASNGSDAFRMFALVTDEKSIEQDVTPEIPLIKPAEYTLNTLWAERESQNWRKGILRI